VSVLVTVRSWLHRNAFLSSAGVVMAGAGGVEPGERRLPGLGVGAAVVDNLEPGGEQAIELGELDAVVDLDRELIANRPENLSILPFVVAARGHAWISFAPSTSYARSNCEDTNAGPRSTFCARPGYVLRVDEVSRNYGDWRGPVAVIGHITLGRQLRVLLWSSTRWEVVPHVRVLFRSGSRGSTTVAVSVRVRVAVWWERRYLQHDPNRDVVDRFRLNRIAQRARRGGEPASRAPSTEIAAITPSRCA
jgi:hypothetical protein